VGLLHRPHTPNLACPWVRIENVRTWSTQGSNNSHLGLSWQRFPGLHIVPTRLRLLGSGTFSPIDSLVLPISLEVLRYVSPTIMEGFFSCYGRLVRQGFLINGLGVISGFAHAADLFINNGLGRVLFVKSPLYWMASNDMNRL
jgi:hypothetical protein